MREKKPLIRHPALIELSRDHHEGLLLCWKIRTGLKQGVDPERMGKYVEYIFNAHILDHFRWEEEIVFRHLEKDNILLKKALKQHNKLRKLVKNIREDQDRILTELGLIEELLDQHIRFEERQLFSYLQENLGEADLGKISSELKDEHKSFNDEWPDAFWISKN